jgi:hypothetical protein
MVSWKSLHIYGPHGAQRDETHKQLVIEISEMAGEIKLAKLSQHLAARR